jgi:hypothetical protein
LRLRTWLHCLRTRLSLWLRSRNLWLCPHGLLPRLSLRPWWQSGPRLWLGLRRPASLSLRRASFYSLRRRCDHPWLRCRHISNCALRLLPLRSCLFLRRPTLLLCSNHLLARSFSLRLLLLTNHGALRRLRLHWLSYPLSLRFTGCTHACQWLWRALLLTQVSHLLSRRLISSRCLSREIGHLTLAGLVGRNVRLRSGLLCGRVAMIRDLQLLIANSGRQWLDIKRPCEIAFEWRRDGCIRRHD